ncbi:hypothetical protein [Stutzerimonas nosocomialis]|nr:hypothetical protein [Stutzerimonas nosocomialis]
MTHPLGGVAGPFMALAVVLAQQAPVGRDAPQRQVGAMKQLQAEA